MRKQNTADLLDFRIFETNEYLKRLSKISDTEKAFIEDKSKSYIYPQLRQEPHYGINIKKLIGYNPDTWRYRLGKFRLFYIIDDTERIIYLVTIEYRKDAYK